MLFINFDHFPPPRPLAVPCVCPFLPYPHVTLGATQFVVFGDSQSDAGRRYNAPASHVYEGIGVYPWTKLYEAPDSEVQ